MKFDLKRVKIYVTVPVEYLEKIRDAVCGVGAGIIGNYTYCTTSTQTIGTFMPNNWAHPFMGKKNNLEFVNEDKLEFICDVNHVKSVLKKLREVHPYEEPVIDIVPLIDETYFN